MMDASTRLKKFPEARQRVRILDLHLDRAGITEVTERLDSFVQDKRPHHVVTVNLQFLSLARKNPGFTELLNNADLVVADGMPLVWLSRFKGASILSRITGHDLLQQSAALASTKGYSLFLLGGAPGSAEATADHLRLRYPGLRVTGTHHGFFPDAGEAEHQDELTEIIRDFRPEFLFVGLGCPKQELWIHRWKRELGVPVCIGVGSTFDVLAGRLKRAPTWAQRAGLEWLYRLQQEPQRLWRRYLLLDFPTTIRATSSVLREVLASRMRWRRSQS